MLIFQILNARGYSVEYRGMVAVKGKGEMETYFVNGKGGPPRGFIRQPSQHNSWAVMVLGVVQSRKRYRTVKRHCNSEWTRFTNLTKKETFVTMEIYRIHRQKKIK